MDWEKLGKLVELVQELARKSGESGGHAGVWLHNLWLIGESGQLETDVQRGAAVAVLNHNMMQPLRGAAPILALAGEAFGVDVEGFIDLLTIAAFAKATLRMTGVDVAEDEPGVPLAVLAGGDDFAPAA
jgi:hypothetical protein